MITLFPQVWAWTNKKDPEAEREAQVTFEKGRVTLNLRICDNRHRKVVGLDLMIGRQEILLARFDVVNLRVEKALEEIETGYDKVKQAEIKGDSDAADHP